MKTSILCLLLALAAPCAMSQPRPNLARAAAEAAASAAAAAPVEAGVERAEAEAWRIARAGERIGALFVYLRKYPEGHYAAEARRRILASRLQPQGRLVGGGERCVALIDERGASMLKSYHGKPEFAGQELRWPAGELAARTSVAFVMHGKPLDQARVEEVVALDLVAGRDGGCTVHMRYSYGSGLPPECRCEPVDPTFVFQSALARAVLAEYSGFAGAAEACAARQADLPALAETFLDQWVSMYGAWAEAMRRAEAQGKVLFPSERGTLEDVLFALPRVRERTRQPEAFAQGKAWASALSGADAEAFCSTALPARIQNAVMRTLLSTRPMISR